MREARGGSPHGDFLFALSWPSPCCVCVLHNKPSMRRASRAKASAETKQKEQPEAAPAAEDDDVAMDDEDDQADKLAPVMVLSTKGALQQITDWVGLAYLRRQTAVMSHSGEVAICLALEHPRCLGVRVCGVWHQRRSAT